VINIWTINTNGCIKHTNNDVKMTRTFFNCNKNRYISRWPRFLFFVFLLKRGLSTCGDKFEDNKGVIRIRRMTKEKGQKDRQQSTNLYTVN